MVFCVCQVRYQILYHAQVTSVIGFYKFQPWFNEVKWQNIDKHVSKKYINSSRKTYFKKGANAGQG